MNLTSQFEYEKLARLVDETDDTEWLREKLKEFIKLHYIQKETTATLLYNK
jgi:hypothetical protein